MYHGEVSDELVEKVRERVLSGMGFFPMHSAHHSKPFKRILGATGDLTWGRNQTAIVWNLCPTHPIAKNIPAHFTLFEELYAEPFFIPKPDDLIFGTWFEDGNIFRSGCCFRRGQGKIFYFRPGHEEYPIYYREDITTVLTNAVRWAAPRNFTPPTLGKFASLENKEET